MILVLHREFALVKSTFDRADTLIPTSRFRAIGFLKISLELENLRSGIVLAN